MRSKESFTFIVPFVHLWGLLGLLFLSRWDGHEERNDLRNEVQVS